MQGEKKNFEAAGFNHDFRTRCSASAGAAVTSTAQPNCCCCCCCQLLLLLLLLLLLQVWQVRASYDAKPYRKTIMQTWCVGLGFSNQQLGLGFSARQLGLGVVCW
jgi:hypothetical protein